MMMGLISRYLTRTPVKAKLSKAATVAATIRKTVRTPSACEGLCLWELECFKHSSFRVPFACSARRCPLLGE
jgi:hypothetical protein